MFSITTSILIACIQTPKEWQDKQLDAIDRKSMEQMVSFSPPQIPTDSIWVVPDDKDPPTWSDLIGKVVIVQSWSNSDVHGRQIIGAMDKIVSKTKAPLDVVLITIHTPEGVDLLDTYQKKHPIKSPTVIDKTGELCNKFGFYKDPTNIVIDRNGAVQYVGLGIKGLISAVNDLIDKPRDLKTLTRPFKQSNQEISTKIQYPNHNNDYGRAKNWQGKPAPTFVVEEWLTDSVNVEGMVRVVEFWATWCAPCRKSIPHINEYAKHFKNKVAFVSVSNEPTSKVIEFMKKTKMEYGVAIDTQERMKKAISCSAIPLALVISSDGVVRWQGNPLRMSEDVIQHVLSADRGKEILKKRGRWNLTKTNEK